MNLISFNATDLSEVKKALCCYMSVQDMAAFIKGVYILGDKEAAKFIALETLGETYWGYIEREIKERIKNNVTRPNQ